MTPGIAAEIAEMDRLLVLKTRLLKIAKECAFVSLAAEIAGDIAEIQRSRAELIRSVQ